jgi:hypothetical protein
VAYKVFVSYSTKDFPSVDALRKWLQLPGVECFVSEYAVAPGVALAPAIQGAIRGCDLFVVLWSKSAAQSEWVPQEIGIAHGCGKPILPFVLEDGIALPGFIKDLRYVPAYRNVNEAMHWLREVVLTNSMKQSQQHALGILALGGLLLLLLKSE